jgi:hypothetical protein
MANRKLDSQGCCLLPLCDVICNLTSCSLVLPRRLHLTVPVGLVLAHHFVTLTVRKILAHSVMLTVLTVNNMHIQHLSQESSLSLRHDVKMRENADK